MTLPDPSRTIVSSSPPASPPNAYWAMMQRLFPRTIFGSEMGGGTGPSSIPTSSVVVPATASVAYVNVYWTMAKRMFPHTALGSEMGIASFPASTIPDPTYASVQVSF